MHRTALLFSAICFMLAVAAAVFLANRSADYVERHATHEVESALLAAGQNWATIRPDGLIVNLTGLAPDEAGHLRAIEIMGEVIDAGRIGEVQDGVARLAETHALVTGWQESRTPQP